jgi:hypothetical protein
MNFSSKFVAFIVLGLAVVVVQVNGDILGGGCITDGMCRPTEYCDHDFPNPIGKCKMGQEEGQGCFRDRYCASKICSFFKCKKRIQIRNGPCKISADCPDDQFCDDIPNREDLRQCFDRKCLGSCRKDSQCRSDKCHLFICAKSNDC